RNRQTPLNKCSVLPMGRTALNKQNKNGNSNCRWREIIVDVEQRAVKFIQMFNVNYHIMPLCDSFVYEEWNSGISSSEINDAIQAFLDYSDLSSDFWDV
ncbi:MAG: hypothetical protein RAP03_12450, partial [Candidatus Electryonea clarkiae]|nr:hypothetical protein [Candidatus Electryonea clarkiae]